MAQLYYRYATMNAGKSIEVLRVHHNYESMGKRCLLFTSSLDDRYGTGVVTSRIGVQKPAILIDDAMNLYNYVEDLTKQEKIYCIIVDEAQFMKENHIFDLVKIVDELKIPVICYGLKNDFRNKLFEGSELLLRFADKIEEIKTICTVHDCGRKAAMVLRTNSQGKPVYSGEQIVIGGNNMYHAVCRKHYYNPVLNSY